MQKMKSDPNNTDTLLELARLFSDQGNTEEAEELLQRALINAPSDSRPPYFMGILFAQQNKWTEAAQQLERSIQLGDDAFARYSLAVIYRYHLNRETDAKVHYETAAKLCNDPALASMIKAELEK
jgi:tetratricopeptide (TPR) repeat protein